MNTNVHTMLNRAVCSKFAWARLATSERARLNEKLQALQVRPPLLRIISIRGLLCRLVHRRHYSLNGAIEAVLECITEVVRTVIDICWALGLMICITVQPIPKFGPTRIKRVRVRPTFRVGGKSQAKRQS